MKKIALGTVFIFIVQLSFGQELIPYEEHFKYGFKDENGNVIIYPKYRFVEDYSEGLAAVCLNGKWGFMDKTGKVVVPPIYDEVSFFVDGLAVGAIRKAPTYGQKFGFIDKTGKVVIPIIYDEAKVIIDVLKQFHKKGAYATVKLGSRRFCIDKNGNEISIN